jgi:hypothetical protein
VTPEHVLDRHSPVDSRRRWLRIIGIIDACEWAGLTPVATPMLHTIAYLADALSPVWSLDPMDATVLKRSAGPYYPELQQDVDRLIGIGVLQVAALIVSTSEQGELGLNPKFKLNPTFGPRILSALKDMPDESDVLRFLSQVVQAYSRLSDDQMTVAMTQDATYGDPTIETGEVIDLGEWVAAGSTTSARAAERLNDVADEPLEPAETIELYVDHIIRRVVHANA